MELVPLNRKTLLFGFFILSILVCFDIWFFSPSTGDVHVSTDKWRVMEREQARKMNNKYYDEDEMYFMSIGWPTLVRATEFLSKDHVKQADRGWSSLSFSNIETSTLGDSVSSLIQKRKGIVDGSYMWSKYWDDCWHDKENLDPTDSPRVSYFRLSADPICSFLWMLRLRQEPIEYVDQVLAVVTREDEKTMGREDKPQQNGGMRALLSSSIHGYWKPCTLDSGNGESYLPEIVAFHIDRIVQFNRAPAVVPRFIVKEDFDEIAENSQDNDQDIHRKFDSVLTKCGSDNRRGAEGSFVGWSPFGVELLGRRLRSEITPRLARLSAEELSVVSTRMGAINRSSDPVEIDWALEIITGHMFGVLIGTVSRFLHNQHFFLDPVLLTRGPMIYIDNDRAQWGRIANDVKNHHPMEDICIFPEHLSRRIMMLSATKTNLGDIILSISDIYKDSMKETPLFTPNMKSQLQKNVVWLAKTIYNCISKHGEENVLIPEHWESSSYDNINLSFGNRESFFRYLSTMTD